MTVPASDTPLPEPALRRETHWGRIMRCYAQRPTDLLGHFRDVVAARPDAVAVVDGDLRLTYAQLQHEAGSLAALLATQGVGTGDRVAVMLDNSADAVRAVLAVLQLGAVLVAVSTRSRGPELDYICTDCTPAALVLEPKFADVVAAAPSAPGARFDISSDAWRTAVSQPQAAPEATSVEEEAFFAILYTSGTTGRPKGAMLTHLGAIHSCLHWRDALALGAEERSLLCVPWAHVSGLCGVLMPMLYLGSTLVMLADFKRRVALELLERERITHALMVPAMYGLCLLEPDLAAFDLSTWRIAAYGGAPMPEPTIARFAAAFPQLAMCNAYGATETTSPTTIMPPGEGIERADSIGRVVRCGDILVMDDAGREVPPGMDGELWIAGPMVIPGYWGNPDATAASFTGGYWKSGDIGSVDAGGYVRIADRKKDMIIRGGFKIYPAEVESVIAGLHGVVEAAVVGRSDPMLGEAVIAFVTTEGSALNPAAIRAWCAERLSDYKVPAHVIIDTAPLPRNANGKIQKGELRQRAARIGEAAA
ncbi:class I adenylate-forming enzyme family protein [Novosphingobium sp. Chol11]|uniref:class I adenylate-forming enzyme family protein n=1 Tax=Novosphingobium sp. Chol11 TaxID=1385763 RepID=UPI0025FD39B7|nr:class I adenylate-forming enzyme family protein [Novosphingobium sp. Chol11]